MLTQGFAQPNIVICHLGLLPGLLEAWGLLAAQPFVRMSMIVEPAKFADWFTTGSLKALPFNQPAKARDDITKQFSGATHLITEQMQPPGFGKPTPPEATR